MPQPFIWGLSISKAPLQASTQSGLTEAGPARPWPAEQIEFWPIERLVPYANNARVHSEADIDKMADAIRRWGWTMPALVDEDGNLLAGHLRTAAAPRAGVTRIPVMVARGWSEEEKRAYRLADNQLAARASWDFELLRNELEELGFGGFDLGLIGFEPDRLETILKGFGSSGLTDPDNVPGDNRSAGDSARRHSGCWATTELAAATAPARPMSHRCWQRRSLI